MATTLIAPIRTRELNTNLYVGEADFTTIQTAIDYANTQGGGFVVVIPFHYAGTETIASLTNGQGAEIRDERNAQLQFYGWSGTQYVPIDFIQVGNVILNADPTQPLQAATKQYVDAHGGGGSMVYPDPGIGVSDGTQWLSSIDPTTLVTNSDLTSRLGGYLPLAGGVITGAGRLSFNNANNYINSPVASALSINGTGSITLSNSVNGAMLTLANNGSTFASPVTLPGDPTQPLQAATKQYVDNSGTGGGIPAIGCSTPFVASQSIPNGVATIVQLATPTRDDAAFFNSSQPNRLTIPAGKAGWYSISAYPTWPTAVTASNGGVLLVNGSSISSYALQAAQFYGQPVAATVYLKDGDYVQFQISQYGTASQTLGTGSLSIARLGDTGGSSGGGMVWPGAGVPVSTGTAWGTSIPQANIALVNASNTFVPDQIFQGHLHTKNGMSTTGPGSPPPAANQINISNDGTSAFFDCTGPNPTTRGVALFRVVSSDWSLSTNVLQINGNGIFVTGNISATGTKPFVMTHPLDDTKLLTHTCLEGPEVAIFYRGESETVDGYVVVTLPDYFEALTLPEGRTVQLTMIVEDSAGMEALPPSIPFAQLAAGRVKEGKFTVYSSKPSTKFCWEVKAVRADVTIDVVSDKEAS